MILIIYGVKFFNRGFNVNTGEVEGEFEKAKFKIKKLSPGLICTILGGVIVLFTVHKGIDVRTTSKSQNTPATIEITEPLEEIKVSYKEMNVDSLYNISLEFINSGKYLYALEYLNIVKGYFIGKGINNPTSFEIEKNIRFIKSKLKAKVSENSLIEIREESKSYKISDEKFDTIQ